MTVLSKVVSGVKRRTSATASASTSDGVSTTTSESARTKETQPVAPDLRRFSNFMNPFPAVSPGGYTKYYQSKGEALASSSKQTPQYALPLLCELNNQQGQQRSSLDPKRPPPIQTSRLRQPYQQRTSSSSIHSSSRRSSATSKTLLAPTSNGLASIPESSSELQPASSHRTRTPSGKNEPATGNVGNSPHASLRRRKRRLLRTPSVERDFAQLAVTLTPLSLEGTSPSCSPTTSSPSSSCSPSSTHSSPLISCTSSPSSSLGRSSRAKPKPKPNLPALNRAASASSSQSSHSGSSVSTSRIPSDTSSTDSHSSGSSSRGEDEEDAPVTPMDSGVDVGQVGLAPALPVEEFGKPSRGGRGVKGIASAPPPSAFVLALHTRAHGRRGGVEASLGFDPQEDWEPFERPDSRSTYRTARTSFDDF